MISYFFQSIQKSLEELKELEEDSKENHSL